ncbi:galectin-9-like [Sitodiplosis mosellana]|uniref:galectin-9-like n=1 Tax=Sitodiplosis mosellana TaxID=263140 RepID=UPI0024442348|nr:galectin-9-like [Sitodiplosis mosellana]
MAQLPASHPHIPYLGLIPGGFHHGLMIRVTGEMLYHDRFDVEIRAGPILTPSDDINVHLSVRPNEGAIVRNSMISQSWGDEERFGGCPIQHGQRFEILILGELNQFKIAVNGRHFCEFRHRIPLSSARFVHVQGQVKIHSIRLEGDPNTLTPSAPLLTTLTTSMPSYQQAPPQPYQGYQPHHQPHTQYVHPSPYNTFSTTVTAVPSQQQTYPSGQYYYQQPPHQTYYYQPGQPNLSNQPYQQNPSYNTYQTTPHYSSPPKSGSGTKALKYAAGIGGIGLGAYAISKMFDSDGSNSD